MTLGEAISKYLTEHSMSMRAFAMKSGISHAYVSYLINGRPSQKKTPAPSITVYRAVAKGMGIDVNELIDMVDDKIAIGNATPISLTEEESALVLAWRIAKLEDRQNAAFALRNYGLNVPEV